MIRWDDGSDPKQIYDMWQRNFRDPVSYADFYFSQVYGKNKVLVRIDDQTETEDFSEGEQVLKGMIHLNPYSFRMRGINLPVHYIVGVATDEAYRRQGVMRDLLAQCFSWLRKEGECLTYLMPADPAYYLPFDFRFGRPQLEMEFYMEGDLEEGTYDFRESLSPEELAACSAIENEYKKDHYDLFTAITSDYLVRLEKEARADFGQTFYVFHEDRFRGRFCVAAEYDCLILSRVFCGEERSEFLSSVLAFVRKRFHYGNHQIILDQSWEDILVCPPQLPGLRTMPVKARQKIMFRILDLEKLAPCLRSEEEGSFEIVVTDRFFPENEGLYSFECRNGQVSILKKSLPGSKETGEDARFGEDHPCIEIADLTSWLFGGMTREKLGNLPGFETAGADGDRRKMRVLASLASIRPVSSSCIMEIV